MHFVFVILLVAACTASSAEKKPPVEPPPTPTLAAQIKALEDSGAYPKLDRSTDLKGPDQNLNGVRDDVESWINKQPITDVQKRGGMQLAAVFQKALFVDLNDKVALQVVGDEMMASIICIGDTFEPN
ncbi:MAG TPA: hypothetical protein PK702_08370 [Burkholderiaceae bacterium]|nr:hypothetical protein [Burkholderiaceae bacterium]